jgi:glycosyltransferase involved in cell wall biosynthesis
MVRQSSSPRIVIYLHSIFNGGIEKVMFVLADAMIKNKIQVDLVVNCIGFSPLVSEVPDGVNLINLNCTLFHHRLPALLRYIRTSRPDCLLVAGHFANEIALLAKIFSKVPVRVVISEHTNLSTELKSLPPTSLRRIAIPIVDRLLYGVADGIIAVSDGVRIDSERFLGIRHGKCQTIYNPIDTNKILMASEEPLDHSWFDADAPPVIFTVGRLEKQKDLLNLIEAFSQVRKQMDVRLMILGEGSERKMLEAKVREYNLDSYVLMPGFVKNPYPYFKRAAVFALSSQWEGLPTVLIEALTLGLPVVATDCPSGPSEILRSGKYGIIVPTKNSSKLAEGIMRVLKGEWKVTNEGALTPYTTSHVLDEYLKVLRP